MRVYYFAYGSCMDEQDFKRTIPEYEVVHRVTLPDYKLVFSQYGRSRNGGVADIVPAAGEEVQGVVYSFDPSLLPRLDEREGVHVGMYERIEISLVIQGQEKQVYTYQIIDKRDEEIPPSREYAQLIWNGLQDFGDEAHRRHFQQRMEKEFQIKLTE